MRGTAQRPRSSARLLRCACTLAWLAVGAALRQRRPRAPLGSGGAVMFATQACEARYDASGSPVSPATPCALCSAPWLEAVDSASGAHVCRCMANCSAADGASAGTARGGAAASAPRAPPATRGEASWDEAARGARGVQLVIGLGTGRCGTVTLAHLLRAQDGCSATFTHEQHPLLPWTQPSGRAALRAVDGRVRLLLQRHLRADFDSGGAASHATLVGDVASFYLPYVELILGVEPAAKFVVLQRSRDAVVASFLRKDPGVDLWRECANRTGWNSNSVYWAAAHPKYACGVGTGRADSAEAALRLYWDEYAARTAALAARYPDRVRVFASPEVFANASAQADMLAWAGFAAPRVRTKLPRHNCGVSCKEREEWRALRAARAAARRARARRRAS